MRLLASLLLLVVLSGCGQKGPLFKPEPANPDQNEQTDTAR